MSLSVANGMPKMQGFSSMARQRGLAVYLQSIIKIESLLY